MKLLCSLTSALQSLRRERPRRDRSAVRIEDPVQDETLVLCRPRPVPGVEAEHGGQTRDHTERMLREFGAQVEQNGNVVSVLGGVTPSMTVAQEEIFGPVASVMRFDTDDEAVRIANATDYGLTAAICTRDEVRAGKLARRLEEGTG